MSSSFPTSLSTLNTQFVQFSQNAVMDSADRAEIEKEFRQSLSKSRAMMSKKVLAKDEVCKLYGLFRQATEGNCNDWKVFKNLNMLDFDSKDKFSAWVSNRGLLKTEAMERYSTEVNLLATKYCIIFPSAAQIGSVTSLATTTTLLSTFPELSLDDP